MPQAVLDKWCAQFRRSKNVKMGWLKTITGCRRTNSRSLLEFKKCESSAQFYHQYLFILDLNSESKTAVKSVRSHLSTYCDVSLAVSMAFLFLPFCFYSVCSLISSSSDSSENNTFRHVAYSPPWRQGISDLEERRRTVEGQCLATLAI